jgi:quercetin dioxygenase-like cupin family protein
MNKIALFITVAALFATSVAAQENIGKNAKVTLVFDQELPNVPGKSLRVVLVEYGPGGVSEQH